MIQANELRIGNWIRYKEIPTIVLGINALDQKYLDPDGDIYDLKQCYPIPLTEEILLKCRFRWSDPLTLYCLDEADTICDSEDFKNEEDGDGQLYSVHFYHDGEHLIVENSNENGEYGNMRFGKIKHLHQLQNLYFALTGKELEVNL